MKPVLVLFGLCAALSLLIVLPQPAAAGVMVHESEDVTMELGLRLQPRLSVSRGMPADGMGVEWQRDFLVRRSRVKVAGKAMSAKYSLEWRLDGTGGNPSDPTTLGSSPIPGLENGFLQFPVAGPEFQIRAGLYDQPFSRDRLTSDSKQMAVDRGAVSGVPNGFGMADNAIGVDVRGSLNGGKTTYVVGAYDNRTIPNAFQNTMPMLIGRLDFNLGSETGSIYHDAHWGDGTWYCLGVNGSYQGSLEDTAGNTNGANTGLGVDGMVDVPAGGGRVLVRGELNSITIEPPGGTSSTTLAMMAGAGFLIDGRIQPIVRFDHVKMDDNVGGAQMSITNVGCNYYLKGHNLKVQADLTMASGTGDSVDGGRLQTQVDF